MVLAYDLLEDRRTTDVIITKVFPLCFKMSESFVNLDNTCILRDWAKDKIQKSLVEALNRYKKQEEEKHRHARRARVIFVCEVSEIEAFMVQ